MAEDKRVLLVLAAVFGLAGAKIMLPLDGAPGSEIAPGRVGQIPTRTPTAAATHTAVPMDATPIVAGAPSPAATPAPRTVAEWQERANGVVADLVVVAAGKPVPGSYIPEVRQRFLSMLGRSPEKAARSRRTARPEIVTLRLQPVRWRPVPVSEGEEGEVDLDPQSHTALLGYLSGEAVLREADGRTRTVPLGTAADYLAVELERRGDRWEVASVVGGGLLEITR